MIQRAKTIKSKADRVFEYLLDGGSLNFIEAQQKLHDRSLHSTISYLQKLYSITILRGFETISGFQGKPTVCCRYWIDPKEIQRYKEDTKYLSTLSKS